jgi:F0F1-type ATP synthase assembly protein I
MVASPTVVRPKALHVDPDKKGGDAGDWTRALREAAPLLGIGSTLAVTVLVGLGAGYWLDGRLGTGPLFLIVGGTVGVLAGLYHFYKTVMGKR